MKNIVIALLVIGLAGAGYYIWSTQEKEVETPQPKQEVQKQPAVKAKTGEVKVIPQDAVFEDGTI